MKNKAREEVVKNQFATKTRSKPVTIESASFDIEGNDIDPFSPFCIAKQVQNRYYIKRLKTLGEYRLFNTLEDNVKELDTVYSDTGRGKWEFSSVPEESYEAYVSFVKSKNSVFLRQAERLST